LALSLTAPFICPCAFASAAASAAMLSDFCINPPIKS
jgi:hypothetical protein